MIKVIRFILYTCYIKC